MIKRFVALIAAIVGVLFASLAPAVAIPGTPPATAPTFDIRPPLAADSQRGNGTWTARSSKN